MMGQIDFEHKNGTIFIVAHFWRKKKNDESWWTTLQVSVYITHFLSLQ